MMFFCQQPHRPKHPLSAVISAATLSAVLLLGACSKAPVTEPPPKPLRAIKVGSGETASSAQRTYSGELRARIDTTLGFQVGGKIIERRANIGDHVSAGQVLARLDPQDTRLGAEQANAQLALASAEARRYRELSEKRFVSQAALEDRENKLKAAQAQAALAKNQASYTTLVAEKAGVIGLVLADVGQVVTPGQGVFRMAPDGDREISLSIPESELSRFRVGMHAEVTLFALPGQHYAGTVREISPTADPVTRTYPLRVQLQGVEKLPSGLTATVRFNATEGAVQGAQQTIPVPLTAVYQQGSEPAVWVLGADNKVSLRKVTVARFSNDHALITEGLTGNETIAYAGVNSLIDGQLVRPIIVTPGVPK